LKVECSAACHKEENVPWLPRSLSPLMHLERYSPRRIQCTILASTQAHHRHETYAELAKEHGYNINANLLKTSFRRGSSNSIRAEIRLRRAREEGTPIRNHQLNTSQKSSRVMSSMVDRGISAVTGNTKVGYQILVLSQRYVSL